MTWKLVLRTAYTVDPAQEVSLSLAPQMRTWGMMRDRPLLGGCRNAISVRGSHTASWTTVQYHCPPCPWIAENITEIDVLSFRVVRSHQAEEAALMVGWSKRSVGGSSIFRRLAENGAGYGYGHAWCISGIPITASSSFFWALDPP